MMPIAWAFPLTIVLVLAQGGIMLMDELYYHRRRGLGRFESFGHPVDTLVFLAALLVPAFSAPTYRAFILFGVLACVSTLVITKDEFIHAKECSPGEHWLHAILFVLHAPVLIGIAVIWRHDPSTLFLRILPPVVFVWAAYQFIYWMRASWRLSTTHSTKSLVSAGTTTTPTPSRSYEPSRGLS